MKAQVQLDNSVLKDESVQSILLGLQWIEEVDPAALDSEVIF